MTAPRDAHHGERPHHRLQADVGRHTEEHPSWRAQAHGLIVRNLGDSIAFTPPLIVTEADIDEILARFGKALDETTAWVEGQKLRAVA